MQVVGFQLGEVVVVAGLLALSLSLVLLNDGSIIEERSAIVQNMAVSPRNSRIGLGNGKDNDGKTKSSEHRQHPEEPSPACATNGDVSTDDRSNCRSSEGSESEERQSLPSNIRVPNIRNDTTARGQRASGESSTEESEDQDGRGVGCQRATDLEARIDDECSDEDWPSTILFGERSPYEWSNAVSGDEKCDGEDGGGVIEMKVGDEVSEDS